MEEKKTDTSYDVENLFQMYCDFMNCNNKGAQIGVYSLAVLGVAVAMHRVKPFTKFYKSSQIPNSYIKKRIEITGTVERIEPRNTTLLFDHKPLLPSPFASNHLLPVKIANVQVNALGMNWLQTIVAGNEVVVVPLNKQPNYLLSEVFVVQKEKDSKKVNLLSVGETLMYIGFGKFEPEPPKVNDIMHKRYIDQLKYAEEKARKRELGIQYYTEPILKYSVLFIQSLAFVTWRIIRRTVRFLQKKLMQQWQQKKIATT